MPQALAPNPWVALDVSTNEDHRAALEDLAE
jgi:hypothetical protein